MPVFVRQTGLPQLAGRTDSELLHVPPALIGPGLFPFERLPKAIRLRYPWSSVAPTEAMYT